MSEWKEVRLGDVLNLRRGYDLPHSEMREGNIPVAGSNGIIGTHDVATPIEPCITVGRSGSAGSTFIYDKAWAHNTTLYIDDFKGNDPKYLYYLLLSLPLKKMAGGSAVPSLNRNHIHPLSIFFPTTLETQHSIASILSSLDDKIAVNRRICENLEAQAQALFKHWFIDFAPFKNGKFIESELGMIPEGWRVGTLGEICKTNKRTLSSKNTPDVIEYLDTGNITANKIDNIQILHKGQDKIPSRAKRLVSEGDIIFSAVRPNQRHYGLLMNPSPSLVVSTGFVVITANWSGYRYFIYRFLIQNSIIETLQAIGEQSVSTYPSINANDIESLKIIIPKKEDVEDFADICCNFYCKIESIEQESSRLSTLRDTLLPKLMSGQIKVDEIESRL